MQPPINEADPTGNLSIRATRGMLWSLAENIGLQAVQLLFSIILARLLLPEQFGLIGMLMLFMALAQALMDSGYGSALIQKKDANHLDECSVFYFNLLISVVLVGFLYITAPLITHFYQEPALTPLTRFLSVSVLFNAFSLVPSALLNKRINFKALLVVSLISIVISGAIGVGMAMNGMGVWSLAVQYVLNSLIRAMLLWQASHWRPSRIFSGASLRSMFSFGSRMMISGMLGSIFGNIYQPLIGKLFSVADVGYYGRAQTLQTAAIQPTGSALGRVMFPALSPIQDERDRLKQAVQKTTIIAVFFHFPLMIGLIVVANALITLLLTERWAPSIPYFQLLCVVGLLWPLHVLNLNNLLVMGRSDLFLRLDIIKYILIILSIAITYRWGINALLYGHIAISIIAYFLNSFYSGQLIGYSSTQQIIDVFPFLIMSLLMGVGMFLTGMVINHALAKLFLQLVVGLAIYLGLNFVISRSLLSEVIHLARQAIRIPIVL